MKMKYCLAAGLVLAATSAAVSPANAQKEIEAPPEYIPHEIIQLLAGRVYRADTKFPDMTITGVTYTYPVQAPYTAKITFSAIATNTGGVAFNHKKAFLVLYRGTAVSAKIPLGDVPPGGIVTFKHSVSESYPPPDGGKYHPDYIIKIEYDPYTKALSKKHIDDSFANNQKSIPQTQLANKVEKDYRTWYCAELLKLINQHRAGKGALKFNASLAKGAQAHSEWMASTKKLQHANTSIKENIYAGSSTPQDCFNSWKGSTGHNAAMLGAYTEIGIGQKGGYVTARFQ